MHILNACLNVCKNANYLHLLTAFLKCDLTCILKMYLKHSF